MGRILGEPAEVAQVARYLADEYQQIGDSLLVISKETGQAIAKLGEEDIWQPPPVPREGSTALAQPLPRMRPDLEGFLVHWTFERARDARLEQALAARLPQNELQRQEGDRRLFPVTRAGRKRIVEEVRAKLPTLLPKDCSGSSTLFLSHFTVQTEEPQGTVLEPLLRCVARSRDFQGIQDPRTMNLHFDRTIALSRHIANEWVREIARTLSTAAREHFKPWGKPCDELVDDDFQGTSLWVAEPNTAHVIAQKALLRTVAVEGAFPTGFRKLSDGDVGVIVLHPDTYALASREVFDRWEVVAMVEFTLWVDWRALRTLNLTDVPMMASVEL